MTNSKIAIAGKPLKDATKALIMVHGRGGSATDILSLAELLPVADFALLAPQAEAHTWYPYSFMEKQEHNEPALSASLDQLEHTVQTVRDAGLPDSAIYFLGFSQGACLTLEYCSRHARRWGGTIAFTGGLIGDQLNLDQYKGDFGGTPVLITSGDPDPHVPVQRVQTSADLLRTMHASVQVEIFPSRPHTISREELKLAEKYLDLPTVR